MSDCIHIKVCGKCYAEPNECGCYEQRRGKCKMKPCDDHAVGSCERFWRCSECGEIAIVDFDADDDNDDDAPIYCPWCGREVEA